LFGNTKVLQKPENASPAAAKDWARQLAA
jgi:hypothetical protein